MDVTVTVKRLGTGQQSLGPCPQVWEGWGKANGGSSTQWLGLISNGVAHKAQAARHNAPRLGWLSLG